MTAADFINVNWALVDLRAPDFERARAWAAIVRRALETFGEADTNSAILEHVTGVRRAQGARW